MHGCNAPETQEAVSLLAVSGKSYRWKIPPERAKISVCGGKQVEEESIGSSCEGEKPPERAKKGICGGKQVEEESFGSSRKGEKPPEKAKISVSGETRERKRPPEAV